jgi:hypothetical protein
VSIVLGRWIVVLIYLVYRFARAHPFIFITVWGGLMIVGALTPHPSEAAYAPQAPYTAQPAASPEIATGLSPAAEDCAITAAKSAGQTPDLQGYYTVSNAIIRSCALKYPK